MNTTLTERTQTKITYRLTEIRYEGTESENGFLNVDLPLTDDNFQIHFGQYLGTKTKEQAIENAETICKAVNTYDDLMAAHYEQVETIKNANRRNDKLKAINDSLLDALKEITKTFENICVLYAEEPINWENYKSAKEAIKNAQP